jgi:outer membrane protein TolC
MSTPPMVRLAAANANIAAARARMLPNFTLAITTAFGNERPRALFDRRRTG